MSAKRYWQAVKRNMLQEGYTPAQAAEAADTALQWKLERSKGVNG